MNNILDPLIEKISGTVLLNEAESGNFRYLITDSRKIDHPSASLFFALKGERHNGHDYIPEAYRKGVRAFVVQTPPESPAQSFPGSLIIQVADSLHTLQDLAAAHRAQFELPVLAITGSNGKTIIKEWMYQLLREDKNIVRSPKSYNSQIGVPLSVWEISKEHDLGIFEAGISRPGEMVRLEKIVRPTHGLFTNIGDAHSENFQDNAEKIREKLQLFKSVSVLFFCKDHSGIAHEISSFKFQSEPGLVSWSSKGKADLQVGKIERNASGAFVQGVFKNRFVSIRIPFSDEASLENAIHCWLVLLYLEVPDEVISERMKLLAPVAMRLEMKAGINNCSIINDTYNSDLGSLSIALDFLEQQKQQPEKLVILSDILQSGKDEKKLYAEVAGLFREKNIHRLIGIGPVISRMSELFPGNTSFFPDTESFLEALNPDDFHNLSVLIKGARTFEFERISRALQQKAHETVLEINLNALINNLNHFRSKLKNETRVMAMVKAFSYGSGSFEIANALQFHRVNYLGVAYADEGVELRKAGITVPIMVMNPEAQSYDAMIRYGLEPEIYSFRVLNLFDEALRRTGSSAENHLFPVHLKLDTGMKRLGFEEKDLNELIMRIKNNKRIKVASVFSHLVASDEPVHDDFTRHQIKKFNEMSEFLRPHFPYPFLRHILNSSGVSRFPDAQFDLVRLGIGLYGISPDPEEQAKLFPVSTLKSTISQIKFVPAGETIGYGRKGKAKTDLTIATVPVGYADGFRRGLSNGAGYMTVNGFRAPVVGNVCMDMCMIDISGIPAREGDEVEVFGSFESINEMAKTLNTIPYEILSAISSRVKRVYFQE